MARTAFTRQLIDGEGESLVIDQPADLVTGNSCQCPGFTLFAFLATAGGSVTIRNPRYDQGNEQNGLKVPDRLLTLQPATIFLWICPPRYYEQGDGFVYLDFDQATMVAAYEIGR